MELFKNFKELFLSVWDKGILGIDIFEILIGLGIFLIFLIFRGLISKLIIKKLEVISKRTTNKLDDTFVNSMVGPARFLPIVLGFFIASYYMSFDEDSRAFVDNINRTLITILIFWIIHQIIEPISYILSGLGKILTRELIGWIIKSLKIKSKRFSEIIRTQNISVINDFNQAFIHSSENKIINYEKLEFFGDAVLRLAASNFIEKKYPQMSVGERSELRAQIVSDEWLTKLGEKIDIEKLIIKGPKALGDENSKNTIIGEATEALIGAIYKCFNSIQEVNIWLDDIWEEDSETFLKAPYKFKSKTVLQEWCQSKGFDLPVYKIIEVSKKNGDPKRFSCAIFIEGLKESFAFGKSHKQAETNAARVLIEKFITIGKI